MPLISPCATAGSLTTLAGPPPLPPTPGTRPSPLGQVNITENDPPGMTSPSGGITGDVTEKKIKGIIVHAGGIVAYYP